MPQQHKSIEEIRAQFHAEYNAQQAEFDNSGRYLLLANILILGIVIIGFQTLMMYLAN